MVLVRVLVGIGLLLMGRKLFWLFVALLGFTWGMRVGSRLLPGQPESVILIIAFVTGILGALITVFLQRLAIGLAGFLGGAYIALSLFHVSGWGTRADWIILLIGGVLGLVLMLILFQWALVIISSALGAALITETVPAGQSLATLLFILLFIIGVMAQFRLWKLKRS